MTARGTVAQMSTFHGFVTTSEDSLEFAGATETDR